MLRAVQDSVCLPIQIKLGYRCPLDDQLQQSAVTAVVLIMDPLSTAASRLLGASPKRRAGQPNATYDDDPHKSRASSFVAKALERVAAHKGIEAQISGHSSAER